MKKLVSSMVLSFIVMSCYAEFHSQFTEVKGGMNVSTLDGGGQAATYLRYTAWGVSDLQALTSDNRTFELKPNINNYADATTPEAIAEWRNGLDGNRWLGAITFWERVLDGRETGASFTYSVDQWNNLNSRYSTLAFIQVIDPLDDYKVLFSLRSDEAIISTSATGSDITLSLNFGSSTYADKILQAGFSMEGINANPDTDWGSITVTAKDAVVNIEDNTPPTPNPMLFHEVPTAISDNEITMTASNAVDNAYGVEYNFICDTDRDLDSGWQSSPYYKNTGLAPGTTHSYRVTCRDTSPNQNVTMPSVSFSATTLANDADAPLPNPAEVAGVSSMFNSVTLTAVEATDASAVEYNFTSVVGGGHSSGWQSSPVYTDNGLLPGTAYDYTVQARDLSASTNITAVSEVVSVITASEVPNLVLAPNGDLHSIPLEDLSPEDLTYVRTLIPPDVVVSVRAKESVKDRNEEFIWANDKLTVVTAEVEVRKKSRSPYQGTLKAEVYLIGKEMVTGAYTPVGKGTSRVHFTEENKGRYTFNTSATYRVYEEYNNLETRGAEYEGYLAVVVDPQGNKLVQESDLSWLLDENIDALRQFYVGIFFDETCKKRSVPRPRYYDGRERF